MNVDDNGPSEESLAATEEVKQRIFVGVSREGSPDFGLEGAIRDAWRTSRGAYPGLRSVQIEVRGTNPIKEYRIVMEGTP